MSLQFEVPDKGAQSVKLETALDAVLGAGIYVYKGGISEVMMAKLTPAEESKLISYLDHVVKFLTNVSPVIAREFERHKPLFVRAAQMFKAIVNKSLEIPPMPGTFGCTLIFPEAVKYTATPSATAPAYTSYKSNLWEIDLTAGTAAYILGDGTNYYRASPTPESRSMLVIIEGGLVEVGTTPKIYQMRIFSEQESARGPQAVYPLVDIPVEPGKTMFVYNTPALIVRHDFGIMWGVMPHYSGTAVLKLIGLVFYEYGFYSKLAWI